MFVLLLEIVVCLFYSNQAIEEKDEKHVVFPPEDYLKTESGHHDGPKEVTFSLAIESVIRIISNDMEFIVNSYVIEEWIDTRLARDGHHDIVLTEANDIWTPDVYCVNCRKSTLGSKSTRMLVKVSTDGRVYLSQPGLLNPACNFKFEYFPFDVQQCSIQFASFSNNDSVIEYVLKHAYFLDQQDLEQFTVEKTIKKSTKVVEYMSGNYTIIEIGLKFKKQVGFYLIRVYIPTIILVSLCWIAFYLSPSDIQTRLTIGISLILSMIFLLGNGDSSMPKVSYIKAIDWFMIMALVLIVLVVLESIGVYCVLTKGEDKKNMEAKNSEKPVKKTVYRDHKAGNRKECEVSVDEDTQTDFENSRGNSRGESIRMQFLSNNIIQSLSKVKAGATKKLKEGDVRSKIARFEVFSRIAFPLFFLGFAIAYSYHYTRKLHE